MDQAAIFIDGAYLDKLLQHEFTGAQMDFGALSRELSEGLRLFRTHYYHCAPYQSNPPTSDERTRYAAKTRFFTALNRLSRFEVRLGRLAKRGVDDRGNPIFQQKRVDIMLGVDMVELAATRQIACAVLIAGDSDFLPAVEAVKRNGVSVVLWHGPKSVVGHSSYHQDLWDACDERNEFTPQFIQKVRRQ